MPMQLHGMVPSTIGYSVAFRGPRPWVDPRAYGATGDGTTDDHAAFTSAIASLLALGGGTLYVPAGTYRLSSYLRLYGNIDVVGAGMGAVTLLWDDPSDGVIAGAPLEAYCFYVYDQFASAAQLNAAPSYGDRVVRLATANDHEKFAVGDTIQLYSEDNTNSTALTSPFSPWTTRVIDKELSGGNRYLWLEESVPWAYTGTCHARYRQSTVIGSGVNNADRVTIRDLTISVGDGSGNEQNARNRGKGIHVNAVDGFVAQRVRCTRGRSEAFLLYDSRNLHVSDCEVDWWFSSRSSAESGGNGTGFYLNNCSNSLLSGNRTQRTNWGYSLFGMVRCSIQGDRVSGRPAIAASADPATDTTGNIPSAGAEFDITVGRGMRLEVSTLVDIDGLSFSDVGATTVYVGQSTFCSVKNSTFDNCGYADQAVVSFFDNASGGSAYNKAIGNTIRKSGGIGIQCLGLGSAEGHHVVAGNVIENVKIGVSLQGTSHCAVSGNVVANCTSHGIQLGQSSDNTPAISNTVTGNTVEGNSGNSIVALTDATGNVIAGNLVDGAITTTSSDGGNRVSGNITTGAVASLHALDEPIVQHKLTISTSHSSSGTWAVLTNGTDGDHAVTHFSHSGRVLLEWSGLLSSGAGSNFSLTFAVDGSNQVTLALVPGSTSNRMVNIRLLVTVTRGSHTYQVRGQTSTATAGTIDANLAHAVFTAQDQVR